MHISLQEWLIQKSDAQQKIMGAQALESQRRVTQTRL